MSVDHREMKRTTDSKKFRGKNSSKDEHVKLDKCGENPSTDKAGEDLCPHYPPPTNGNLKEDKITSTRNGLLPERYDFGTNESGFKRSFPEKVRFLPLLQ